jgi:hypothetical protein
MENNNMSIEDHNWFDEDIEGANTSLEPQLLITLELPEQYPINIDLHREDVIALAKHFNIKPEDLE